jgi:hypothetical protein
VWITIISPSGRERTLPVPGNRCVVGRDPVNDIVLEDPKASRTHASVSVLPDGRLLLEDLGASNGTFVNGHRVVGSAVLVEHDRVQVGDTTIVAALSEPTPSRAPGPATVERQVLRRSTRRATAIAVVSLVVAVVVAAGAVITTVALRDDGRPTPRSVATGSPSVPEVIEAVRPSVLSVSTERGGLPFAGGTGWVLDASEGLVVTNAHVVNGGTSFSVDVAGERRPAALIGVAPCEDLAVLRVDDTIGLQAMELGSQDDLEQGETVIALG